MTLDLPLSNNNSKQPSEELLKLIDELGNKFLSTRDVFVRVVNKAKDEGFNDKEIDSLLYSKLKKIIPRKTLFRYREEFIPLAIDKRNNNNSQNDTLTTKNNIEKDYVRSGSNDTTTIIDEPEYQQHNVPKSTVYFDSKVLDLFAEQEKLAEQEKHRKYDKTEVGEGEEESRPIKSWTLAEYEEQHPRIAESPFEVIGEINRKLSSFWTALTKQKNMPTREDNVMKDYIIPARTRLIDMLNGSSKVERDFLFNWLTWIIMAAKDCRDLCEKADATAYDTREELQD
jgi:hypothetical protein